MPAPARIPRRIEVDPHPATLAALDARCFAEAWDAATYASLLGNRFTGAWVLDEDGHGPAALLCFLRLGGDAEVYRVGVLPEHRGRGLGRLLLGEFLAHGHRSGLRRVRLEVRESNAAARALYERLGFVASGRRRGYYRDPPEDAVLYTCWHQARPRRA